MAKTTKSRAARTLRAGAAALTAAVVLAAGSAPAAAHHDLYRRVSAGARFGNGAIVAFFVAASTDGKRVFFSSAERLTLSDSDSSSDIYERSGGTTKRVSVGAINGNGAFLAQFAAISSNGTRVFWTTTEKLVAGDTDDLHDIYERSAGSTTLVSAGAINGNGVFSATFRAISSDGTRVFFTTNEQLVAGDTDAAADVYERSAGTTTLVSVGQINGNLAFESSFVGVSATGARAWFLTQEKLVAADIDDQLDIYERSGGSTKRVSIGAINGNGGLSANFVGASTDGSRVFFSTAEQLVTTDTDAEADVYEFSAGTVTLISAGAINGNGANQASFVGASADGTRVFFHTDEQLVSGDTDLVQDVYQRVGGVTSRVSAGTFNGNLAFPATFVRASADGSRVFFTSMEKLVSSDTDASVDLYENAGGLLTRASAGATNGNGAFDVSFGAISADGTRVFFRSAEKLVGDDDDSTDDVYERTAGQTLLVTIGAGEFGVLFKGCSVDGLAVFFETDEKLLASDKDTVKDVYGAYEAF